MAKLVYAMPTSLDGYIAGETDSLDWSAPSEEGLAFITDVLRPIGTHLYGRKMYETMAVWETPELFSDLTPATLEFARLWQSIEKVVYSKTLESVSTAKTRIEREFDLDAVRELKARSPHDMEVSGPALAAPAIRAGLIDEYHLFVAPMILGRGKRIFPSDARVSLELLDERRFGEGWVYVRYRAR